MPEQVAELDGRRQSASAVASAAARTRSEPAGSIGAGGRFRDPAPPARWAPEAERVSDVSPARRDVGRGGVFDEGVGVPAITRRSLLKAGAGAFAGIALRPAETLAAHSALPGIETIALGRLERVQAVELPPDVAVAGLSWVGAATAPLELRARLHDGGWGPWTSAGAHGHGPDSASASPHTGDPLWVGGARLVQVRSAEPVTQARLALVRGAGGAPGPDIAHARGAPAGTASARQPVPASRRSSREKPGRGGSRCRGSRPPTAR